MPLSCLWFFLYQRLSPLWLLLLYPATMLPQQSWTGGRASQTDQGRAESDGGSQGLSRLLLGIKAMSRLTVMDTGGTYSGPDGVEMPPWSVAFAKR